MSSDSEEEDFVSFGTPLEAFDEDSVPKKRSFSIEDQVAKDKHGRRRFHGAFTGGFSAGFFNTAGSLEGWKPSQFKSSRSSKSKGHIQRPEDFMDDEDIDEFGIAPSVLRTTELYSQDDSGSSRKRHVIQFYNGPIPGIPVLKALIEPVRETVGMRLLKRMGWKPGQGVGPRLLKSEKSCSRKLRKGIKVYGCALPSQEEQTNEVMSDDSGEDHQDVTFAPDDFEAWLVKPKDNSFGLGYSGLDRRPVLSSHIDLFSLPTSSLVMQEKMKKVNIRGQAFGVGAFEREDEDIYATEDMSQYDFALDTPKMLAEKRQRERNSLQAEIKPSNDIIEGFLLSSSTVVQKTFSPPTLQPGFTVVHRVRLSRFDEVKEKEKVSVNRLTAHERAAIVHEPDLPSTPEPQVTSVMECTKPSFRPFLADPEKQERYEKYLILCKQGQSEKLKDLQPFTMTEWEYEREKIEFEQAERLYRPLSTAFSDRFVQATVTDDVTDPLVPVARTTDTNEDVRNAAKMKMYGKLTRKIGEWTPHNTLCRRFNIPAPRIGGSSLQTKPSRPKFSVFNFLDAVPFNTSASMSHSMASSESTRETSRVVDDGKDSNSNLDATMKSVIFKVDLESSQQKAERPFPHKEDIIEKLTESSCKIDLYKAIFLSSSEESGSEEDTSGPSIIEKHIGKTPASAQSQNVLRNTSPPRGIFANLDLGNLNKRTNKTLSPKIQERPEETSLLNNSSLSKEIYINLDLESLKTQSDSKYSNPSESKFISNCTEKHKTETTQSGGSSMCGSPCTVFEQCTSVRNNDTSDIISSQLQHEMYGPLLPSNFTSTEKPRVSNSYKNIINSSSDDDWVEIGKSSDSDNFHKHSPKKKLDKKSHRKRKKHKEERQKHKKKKKK